MCIKTGEDELSSVEALMTMSLNALISDTLDIDIDALDDSLDLRRDIGMQPAEEIELAQAIAEYFNGLTVNMEQISTIGDLHRLIIGHELANPAGKHPD